MVLNLHISLWNNSHLLPLLMNWAGGYKTFFMLNSAEYEILNAHKYENIKIISSFRLR